MLRYSDRRRPPTPGDYRGLAGTTYSQISTETHEASQRRQAPAAVTRKNFPYSVRPPRGWTIRAMRSASALQVHARLLINPPLWAIEVRDTVTREILWSSW